MRSPLLLLGFAFAALHCGGSISGGNNQNGECQTLEQGTMTCSTEGLKCTSPTQACSNEILYCTCESGHFYCDAPSPTCGATCPPPALVQNGGSCTTSIENACPATTGTFDCQGQFVPDSCTCMNGKFQCMTSPEPPCALDAGTKD